MAIFYEREETKKEIKIVYKYYPIFMWIMYIGCFLILFGAFSQAAWTQPVGITLLVIVLLNGIAYSGANSEIRRADKEGMVRRTGKKLSFSKPYTAVIKKKSKPKKEMEVQTEE